MKVLIRWGLTRRVTFKWSGFPWRRWRFSLGGWTWQWKINQSQQWVVMFNGQACDSETGWYQFVLSTTRCKCWWPQHIYMCILSTTNYRKKNKIQQTFLSCPEFLCMPPNKLPSFCYGELPSKGRKISFTFTPFPMKIILCFTSHCPKHECFSLSALSVEQSPDGSYKSIPCSISWPFEKCYWILVRFPCLTLLVVT